MGASSTPPTSTSSRNRSAYITTNDKGGLGRPGPPFVASIKSPLGAMAMPSGAFSTPPEERVLLPSLTGSARVSASEMAVVRLVGVWAT